MKKIESILLRGCGFTILILTLFYAFASFGKLTNQAIGFDIFALIFIFGQIISLTTEILLLPRPIFAIRLLIHYASLMVAFCAIFIATGNIKADTPANIFSAVIVFTFLYAFFSGVVLLIKKLIGSLDNRIGKNKTNTDKNNKKPYKSIYSDK